MSDSQTRKKVLKKKRRRRRKKRLKIGEIAVYNKLLGQEEVDECAMIQQDMAERGYVMKIGQILVEKFFLDRPSLTAILKAQASQDGLDPGAVDTSLSMFKMTDGEHANLVERIREKKLLEPGQIDECFELQVALESHGIDKMLGEIIVEMGFLPSGNVRDILIRNPIASVSTIVRDRGDLESRERLDSSGSIPVEMDELIESPSAALGEVAIYRELEGLAPEKVRIAQENLFGRLVVEKGLASVEHVKECLIIQFRLKPLGINKRIGRLLTEKKYIKKSDVRRVLALQKRRWGKIQWADLVQTQSLKPEDASLARILMENAILNPEQIDECRFVQRAMIDLGLSRTLAQVIVEKEYLPREILNAIWKEHHRKTAEARAEAEAEAGPVVEGQTLKSVALSQAYDDILSRYQDEDEEEEVDDAGGFVLKRGSGVGRRAIQSVPETRSKVPLILTGIAGLLATVGGVGIFLVHRSNEQERALRRQEEQAAATRPPVQGPADPDDSTGPVDRPPDGPGPDDPPVAGPTPVEKALAAFEAPVPDLRVGASLEVRWFSAEEEPDLLHLLVAGRARYPARTVLTVELLLGEEIAAREIVAVPEGPVPVPFSFSFGPWSSDFGATRPGAPGWILAGHYRVRCTVRPAREDAWLRAVEAAGLPESGLVAERSLVYPDEAGLEERRKAENRFVLEGLAEVFAGVRRMVEELDRLLVRRAAGEGYPVLEPSFKGLIAAIGDSRSRFDQSRKMFLHDPDPILFDQMASLHDRVLDVCRAVARAGGGGESVAVQEARGALDDLMRSLEFQLPGKR